MRKARQETTQKTTPRKPWGLIATCALCATSLAVAAALFMPKLIGPNEGQILHPAQTYQPAAAVTRTLSTPYYTASYGSTLHELPQPANSASLDARKLADSPDAGYGSSSQIALTVVRLEPGGITQDSSYLLFHSRPEIYSLSTRTSGKDTLIVSTRTTPDYEKVFLWPHDGFLLTIDLTAGGQTPDADAEVESVLNSTQWLR